MIKCSQLLSPLCWKPFKCFPCSSKKKLKFFYGFWNSTRSVSSYYDLLILSPTTLPPSLTLLQPYLSMSQIFQAHSFLRGLCSFFPPAWNVILPYSSSTKPWLLAVYLTIILTLKFPLTTLPITDTLFLPSIYPYLTHHISVFYSFTSFSTLSKTHTAIFIKIQNKDCYFTLCQTLQWGPCVYYLIGFPHSPCKIIPFAFFKLGERLRSVAFLVYLKSAVSPFFLSSPPYDTIIFSKSHIIVNNYYFLNSSFRFKTETSENKEMSILKTKWSSSSSLVFAFMITLLSLFISNLLFKYRNMEYVVPQGMEIGMTQKVNSNDSEPLLTLSKVCTNTCSWVCVCWNNRGFSNVTSMLTWKLESNFHVTF